MSTERDVILETKGNKGVIILNRPKAMNSLTLSMMRKVSSQLKSWDWDPAVKMVIIKGFGGHAFCAGGDMRTFVHAYKDGNLKLVEDTCREAYQLVNLIDTLKTPYVALIDGITMGMGVGITVHGTYRICTEGTVCATPEVAIGFFPDGSASYFLPKLPGKMGVFLALTGHRLLGYDVLKAGIATHYVDKTKLSYLETALLGLPNPSLADIDRTILKVSQQGETDPKKDSALSLAWKKINIMFEADSVESIMDALRTEGSDWSRKQLGVLNKMSPTSLKVTFEALKRGANMDLQNCLKMDYRIALKLVKTSDLYEGVKKVLIDKNNKPVWKPATLKEVTEDIVNSYFEQFPFDKELML
ncbi:3-hydroxyisobutyryl-CoA hydrolase, mitochondrial-like isoform X2 [Uloborus diversus]|nr:3-hydroxyisobutyryl-CoA hydrolase, mitochondrial-like isoform X2 [Uloborus diversus]XP_054716438.1 3-hydroxyisobutyryl-CoA hydrolase, mitochondrial-like isoform X2 [Uloborus diversus]